MLVWIRFFRSLQENTFDKKVKWTLTRKRKLKKNKELTPQKHYCMKKNIPLLRSLWDRWRGSCEKVLQLSRKSGEIRKSCLPEESISWSVGPGVSWKLCCLEDNLWKGNTVHFIRNASLPSCGQCKQLWRSQGLAITLHRNAVECGKPPLLVEIFLFRDYRNHHAMHHACRWLLRSRWNIVCWYLYSLWTPLHSILTM